MASRACGHFGHALSPVYGTCVFCVSVSRRVMTSGKVGVGWGVWRHTAASGCVSGGWNFSDTETQERDPCILAHLLRSVHDACVRSLGGEKGHVMVSWFAFNQYICDLFHSRHFSTAEVFMGYTLARSSWWRMPEWVGPKACVWTPETQGPWTEPWSLDLTHAPLRYSVERAPPGG